MIMRMVVTTINIDVKIVTILVAKVRILFLEWIARLLRMQRRREMMTRKCNNILIDGDQELLMGKNVLVLAKTYTLCPKSLVTF